ncbi:type I secretion system permease/ATPase [Halodesulfovibrio sp.]|jgi:ATP-binding cassette subfamily C protein LapB|uniref:type I secretion system permease/ATPase n=1 Tax=Halodesulfovibrio sp. TaxID=1912772 RepID=UPI0025EB17F6|nr:type I secretion system permease/ATPase [Halodesulfovibrio sp.]MCT4626643.1 type I secretion system permease/ATPase [Halodesulfovibrio sp.]
MTDSNPKQPIPDTAPQPEPESVEHPSGEKHAYSSRTPRNSVDATSKKQSPSPKKTVVDPPLPSDVDYESPLLRSLVQLFALLGKPLTLEQLKTGLPEHGVPSHTSACLRAALQAGMKAKVARRESLSEISNLTLPCIILLKNKGAGVLTSLTETHAKIIFPEMSNTPISVLRDKLNEEYAGYVIFGQIDGRLDKRASQLKLLKTKRWFWDTILYFFPIYKHVGLASIIINLLALASPLFFMNVYDRVVPNNAVDTLWVLAAGIGIALVFDFILRNLRSYFCDVAGKNADVILASRLMQHIMALRLDDKPDSTGTMANNLREFESLREFFSSTTLLAIIDLPFLFVFLGLIHFIGGPMVFIPGVAVPVVILCGLLLQYPFQRAIEAGYKEGAQKHALLIEIINGIETVKTSMAEGHMQQLWEKVVGMSAKSSNHAKRLANFSMTFTMFAAQAVSVFTIVVGVYRISDGELTMGGLIACNILAGRAMAPLSQIAGMLSRMQQSRMALKSLDLIMQLPTEAQDEYTGISYEKLDASITFDSLAFKYPEAERFALEDIHLKIRKGERVGIIGRMGSGKSTLGKLSVGLYRPTEGAVKLGGVDIRQMDIADLRSRTGYVSQDNYLFYGSVRDNIAIGNPQADENAILRAASIAGVTDFVQSHPAGFGLQVGERGMALSGGQRQSIALARALLTDPDIIILDEPSSNMDNGSEYTFKRKLAQIVSGKTLLLITHRLSMLDVVDRLIVMDNGKVVADGPKAVVLDALKKDQIKKAPTRAA